MAVRRANGRAPSVENDDKEDESVDRLTEELMHNIGSEGDNETTVVTLDDEDDEEEEPQPGQAGTRDAKRRNRWGELRASEAEARERAERAERELAAERARAQAFAEAATRQPAREPEKPAEDPTIAEEEKIIGEMTDLQEQWRRAIVAGGKDGPPREESDRFHRRYAELDAKRLDIRVARTVEARIRREREEAARNQVSPEGQAATQYVMMNHPKLANPQGFAFIANKMQSKLMLEAHRTGRNPGPPTPQMLQETCKEVERDLGYATPPPASATTRARFSGMPAGQRANGGGATGSGRRTVELSKAEKQMARVRFRGKSPEEAYKLFAREISED